MSKILIAIILLCIAWFNLNNLMNKPDPDFIWKQDNLFLDDNLSKWVTKIETLNKKILVLKFNVSKMKEEWINEYEEYDKPFTHHRLTMSWGTYKYIQYIPTQWFFNDNDIYE